MIKVRKAQNRGYFNYGWLETLHTFSFNEYIDPAYNNFHYLRVINEDYVQASRGFAKHPHRNMEIITYIIEGELQHQDSMGTGSIIKAGEIQKMSAGSGITHSEFNASSTQKLHLLQIWVTPNKQNIEPYYEQKTINKSIKNELILIAAPYATEHAVKIEQDLHLYVVFGEKDKTITRALNYSHSAWLQVIKGEINLNGENLYSGDGAAIENITQLTITHHTEAEYLLFDMA
jgi:quercetin 2,3-dioxygenase